jgi:HPt (histidine-containing phosphotransfer) domain-containing protein
MQAQIGKPIDPDDLYRVVAGFHSPEVSHVEPREERVERGTRSSPAAPNPPSDRLVAQLANVPGLDVGAGLASTAGRTGLYRGLLRSFVQQFEPFSHELNTLLMEGKLDDARRLAHSLAGVAASLGMLPLADSARRLEHLLANGVSGAEALPEVETKLQALCRSLAPCLRSDEAEVEASPDSASHNALVAESAPWLAQLRRLLSEGDIGAQQLWAQRGNELLPLVPVQTWGQIRRAIENFEFETALGVLDAASRLRLR